MMTHLTRAIKGTSSVEEDIFATQKPECDLSLEWNVKCVLDGRSERIAFGS